MSQYLVPTDLEQLSGMAVLGWLMAEHTEYMILRSFAELGGPCPCQMCRKRRAMQAAFTKEGKPVELLASCQQERL